MNPEIRRRIERRSGVLGLLEALEKLSPGDLQSLMLELYARRQPKPLELLKRHQESRFTRPASVSPQQLARLQLMILSVLPEDFEALELSPLAPLGSCSGLGPVHQNKVVSTIRNLEASADPSNLLALECALRRKQGQETHLAAQQRVVRAQALPPGPYFAHFTIFALASAQRWSPAFELSSLRRHWSIYLEFLTRLFPSASLSLRVTDLSNGRLVQPIEEQIFGPLREQWPTVNVGWDPQRTSGRNYYRKCCFKILLDNLDIGDGGFTDWTQKLLSHGGECLLTSGLGMDRIAELTKK